VAGHGGEEAIQLALQGTTEAAEQKAHQGGEVQNAVSGEGGRLGAVGGNEGGIVQGAD